MKVLLVKPEFTNVFTKLSLIRTEPLELEYMYSICKNNNVEAEICDLTIGNSLKKMLKNFNPDIVAITANFVHIYSVEKYIKIIKEHNKKIITIVGGPHAEVKPEDFYHINGLDVISYSGGFKPFETIINSKKKNLKNIKGICYKNKQKWIQNEREIFEIDKLPFPDRTHFYKNIKKYKYVTMKSCAIVKASYSCPHNCNYCFSTLLNGGRYMYRKPENVVEEIKNINCDNIWIVDDTFYVNKKYLDEFIELIKKERINKKFSLYFRADFISKNPEYMKKLSEIGVIMCAVGLEVIDDEVLEKYNKQSSVNIIQKALEVLKECNITCIGLFMVDIDAEKSYFKKLYKFIKKYRLTLSTISILTPMPGTGQYEKYKDRIITNDYRKWDFVHLTLEPTNMSKITFYRKFYMLYVKIAYLNIRYSVLSPKYLFNAVNASFEYWYEAIKGLRKRSSK